MKLNHILSRGCLVASLLAFTPVIAVADDATAHGTTFAQQTSDQWRASELAGMPIVGPDNKRIGKVTDLLINKAGKAEYVVIGVGGFLGIGQKDVAVPFDAVSFTNEPTSPAAGTAAPGNNLAAQSTNQTAGGVDAGIAASPVGSAVPVGANSPEPVTAHGTVAMTKDQLKDAPNFSFAK